MKLLLLAIVVCLLAVGTPTQLRAQYPPECDVPELSKFSRQYDEWVCQGMTALNTGRYPDASAAFSKALTLNLDATPNVMLFARLAVAQWRAGQYAAADESLDRARIAMSFIVGMYRCAGELPTKKIEDHYGQSVDEKFGPEIASKFCGADTIEFLEQKSFDAYVYNAELVRLYLEAEREMRPRQTSPPSYPPRPPNS